MNDQVDEILSSFPKQRPQLSLAHQKIFEKEYKRNRSGAGPIQGLSQMMESWMHKKVAEVPGTRLLEIGAGTLNHIQYEKNYSHYDVVEPMTFLYDGNRPTGKPLSYYGRIDEIEDNRTYDKIFSIAVLEHMTNLPREIALCATHLAKDGRFVAGIPSEGSWSWALGWRLTTGLSFRMRNGLDYGAVMKHEHVNSAHEIIELCKYFFEDVEISKFPFNYHHASLYTFINASRSIEHRCKKALEK